jgi:hypothetical protein
MRFPLAKGMIDWDSNKESGDGGTCILKSKSTIEFSTTIRL